MARARSSTKNNSTANLGFEARLWLAVSEVRKQHDEGRLVLIGLLPSSLKARPVLRIRYGLLHTFSVLAYTAKELDRSVVVKSQIRTVLQAFRDALRQLFPGRSLVPKTLIFCKDDSYAEDVVHLCREVFGKGNDFCKKITYRSKHPETGQPAQGEQLIQEWSEATWTRQLLARVSTESVSSIPALAPVPHRRHRRHDRRRHRREIARFAAVFILQDQHFACFRSILLYSFFYDRRR